MLIKYLDYKDVFCLWSILKDGVVANAICGFWSEWIYRLIYF